MEDNVKSSKKVFDDDTETESEEAPIIEQSTVSITTKSKTLPLLRYIYVDINKYNFKSWTKFFPDNKVNLFKLLFNTTWNNFFTKSEIIKSITGIETELGKYLSKNKQKIVPPPELVFNIFNIIDLSKIRVIILGQDPYQTDKWATGCSFSTPIGTEKIPSSLHNVYNNMLKFGHVKTKPTTGCLVNWILQGCFMLNASLTTFVGISGAHKKVWIEFTKQLIAYINDNTKNCVFLSWGSDAFKMCANIDRTKHCVIYSTHPSGLGFNKTAKGFLDGKQVVSPSFESTDHFGLANKYLRKNGKTEILWDLISYSPKHIKLYS